MDRIIATALPRHARPARSLSLRAMLTLWQQRRALARLSPEALSDMGLSAADAHQEAVRPLWDVPAHWRG